MPKRFTNIPDRFREPHDVAWSDLPVLFWKGTVSYTHLTLPTIYSV